MTKLEFILALNERLLSLPREEVNERINFYAEMIEDHMEEGLSEEEAVAAVGAVEEIAAQIAGEFVPAKQKKTTGRMKTWEIVLLAVGAPVWLSLLIAAFSVVLSGYVCLWAGVICLWATFIASASCVLAGIGSGIFLALKGNGSVAMVLIGSGLTCGALAVYLFHGSKTATMALGKLTGKTVHWVKKRLSREGE